MKNQISGHFPAESMHAPSNQLDMHENIDNEDDSSQPAIDLIANSRGEPSWTEKDIKTLKEGALCEIKHFQQSIRKKVKIQKDEALITVRKNEALLIILNEDKERVALEVMQGLSINDAFIKCCGILEFDDEDEGSSDAQNSDQR